MIILKTLTWSNWFSYGDSNTIRLDNAPLTQIGGKNGSGKSSIPLIVEEILYGKNSQGKKKSQLANRYKDDPISAVLTFSKDDIEYRIKYKRKSTLSLHLYENEKDISSHSSTETYKTLLGILGRDHKTLSQLMYQSSTSNLEFLTSTDTTRKKFLVNLFNLNKYLEIHEEFKSIYNTIKARIDIIEAKASTIKGWIAKYKHENLTPIALQESPDTGVQEVLTDELTELKFKKTNILDTNKQININNSFKETLKSLDTSILSETIPEPIKKSNNLYNDLLNTQKEIAVRNSEISIKDKEREHLESLGDACPTCTQIISSTFKQNLLTNTADRIQLLKSYCIDLRLYEAEVSAKINEFNILTNRRKEQQGVANEVASLTLLIKENLPTNVIDNNELVEQIERVSQKLDSIKAEIESISIHNVTATAHNSKIQVIEEQLKENAIQLDVLIKEKEEQEFLCNKIDILKKAFGTNGLLSYKIEYLIKDLEQQINTYLAELSLGQFQVSFILRGEKLNIDILDNGKTIGIEELSAGELARINAATLLAIRKLMSAISSTKLNVLFLDEIMGVLDDEGKEKLIETLRQEKDLNTFLVSHEYSHPLIPKIVVIKENKISRLENG